MGYFVRFNRRFISGDLQMKALIEGQPMKFAAMEGPMKTLMILLLGH